MTQLIFHNQHEDVIKLLHKTYSLYTLILVYMHITGEGETLIDKIFTK